MIAMMDDGLIPLNTLKKADRTIMRKVGPVRMDIDDFYAIVQLLEENHCEGLTIQIDGYILDDPKQIERLPKARATVLKIFTSKPFLSIDLRWSWATVYAGEDTMLARGLVSSLTQMLDRHPIIRALRPVTLAAPAILMVQLPMLADRYGYGAVPASLRVSVEFAILLNSLVLVVLPFWWRNFVLYFRRKHDSFWKRHRDRIEKLVFLLIGAGLTLVVQLILKKL